jgi:hypothetical protein
VENDLTPVTFEVMDWNRASAHELVGYAAISDVQLNSLVLANIGHECDLHVPVIKGGVTVEGHDRQKCHVNLKVRVIQALPKVSDAPQLLTDSLSEPTIFLGSLNFFSAK